MQHEQAIVVCAFGWGKRFRLYRETLYVCNKAYRLAGLTQVRLTTQQALGVPSARLDLQFGRESVVLRGIAAVEDARRAAEYLVSWCGKGQREEASQASMGEQISTRELPASPSQAMFHERTTRPVDIPPLFALGREPHTGKGLLSGWKRERMTERLSGADVLSAINVPVRLDGGEQAYYSSRATRCGEPISETSRTTYPAQDHGLLILTDRRLLFIGRRSQLILEYAHLLRISRLAGALSFEADHWQKRAIFTMPQPETCASRLEAISTSQSVLNAPPRARVSSPGAAREHPYISFSPAPSSSLPSTNPQGERVELTHM